MSITGTTLNGSITNSQQTIKLTAYTNPATGAIFTQKIVRVDGEKMLIADDSLSPTLGVVRGYDGTVAVAHNSLAACAYGLASDFTQLNQVPGANETSYSVSGAITIPSLPTNVPQLIYLTKAGVAAMTLAAPAVDLDGLTLIISSMTANAHTVTATGLLNTGTASVNVANFAANAGATVTLVASKGLWNVESANGVTFA